MDEEECRAMAYENDLCELGGQIADAAEMLRRAETLAMRILSDGSDPEDPGWPAMGDLVDKLDAINRLLAELPGDEIRGAIEQAGAYIDEMGDRADGVSY